MNIFSEISSLQSYRRSLGEKTVGFVPTMGALHLGHVSLIKQSLTDNDITILSIFVNPTQFDHPNDFKTYPDQQDNDLTLAESLQIDAVLLPTYEQLYPDNFRFTIQETELSQTLEGKYRPGHFNGVLTVVMKLLLLIHPHHAYFGQKDWQQVELVRDMTTAFFIPTTIITCPTVREPDGLALSSRNQRLTPEQRHIAPKFAKTLRQNKPDRVIIQDLQSLGFTVDYVQTLQGQRLGAVYLGDVRLIDNLPVEEIR